MSPSFSTVVKISTSICRGVHWGASSINCRHYEPWGSERSSQENYEEQGYLSIFQMLKFYVKLHAYDCWKKVVASLSLSRRQVVFRTVFPKFSTSLEQLVSTLQQAWREYHTCYKVLTTLINRAVATKLTTQGCNNIVISRLYQWCWNNLVTSLIAASSVLQVVNSLCQTCSNSLVTVVTRLGITGLLQHAHA